MFGRKTKRLLLEKINSIKGDISGFQSALYSKYDRSEIVSCEECGCLLLKDKKFKLPSTVEVQEVKYYGYSGSPSLNGQPTHWASAFQEVIVEHYKCHKCHPQIEPVEAK